MLDRARDSRRVAKSVRTHEKTMKALGKASGGWRRTTFSSGRVYADSPNHAVETSDGWSIKPYLNGFTVGESNKRTIGLR